MFPHHENENAQTEAATGEPIRAHLAAQRPPEASGQKMASRIGNIERPADVLRGGLYEADALRYALLTAHYRAPMEYGDDTLTNTRAVP